MKKPVKAAHSPSSMTGVAAFNPLLLEVWELIRSARERVAHAVNAGLTLLYWQIGLRIRREILKGKRAEYGDQIVATLSQQLSMEFGPGWSRFNLSRMVQFAEVFPDNQIVATLSRQLGWSHFVELIPLKKPLQRDFYAEMCRVERWSVRTLRKKIDGMLYERTALSRKPAKLAKMEIKQLRETDRLTPDMVFRDPYFLDFLGLWETYAESNIRGFLCRPPGGGFAGCSRPDR